MNKRREGRENMKLVMKIEEKMENERKGKRKEAIDE